MNKPTRTSLLVLSGLSVLLLVIMLPAARALSAEQAAPVEPEFNAAVAALLKFMDTAPEAKLAATPGITPATLKRIMAHRATGAKFKYLLEFEEVSGVTHEELEKVLKPFQDEEDLRRRDADRKDVPDPAARSKAGRLQKNAPGAAGGAGPEPSSPSASSTGAGPIGAVRPNWYGKLPGYDDLDKIDPLKRTEFLETVNHEMCSCGCKGETVAFCLVNDPGCPVVKARAKKIYDDIMTKPPR